MDFDRHAAGASGGSRRPLAFPGKGRRVYEIAERQSDHTLEQRIESLLARVHAARAEIVDRGLDAVRVERELRGGPGESA
jgi:hypothetical protein